MHFSSTLRLDFLIHPQDLCLLTGECGQSRLYVVINAIEFKSIIVMLVFCLAHLSLIPVYVSPLHPCDIYNSISALCRLGSALLRVRALSGLLGVGCAAGAHVFPGHVLLHVGLCLTAPASIPLSWPLGSFAACLLLRTCGRGRSFPVTREAPGKSLLHSPTCRRPEPSSPPFPRLGSHSWDHFPVDLLVRNSSFVKIVYLFDIHCLFFF